MDVRGTAAAKAYPSGPFLTLASTLLQEARDRFAEIRQGPLPSDCAHIIFVTFLGALGAMQWTHARDASL